MTGSPCRPSRLTWCSAFIIVGAVALATADIGRAGEWEFAGSIGSELRTLLYNPAFVGQDVNRVAPSISAEPRLLYEWNDGADKLTLAPFLRLDPTQAGRSHVDLREANWQHIGRGWDLVVGVDKVFWGVTESQHLVDVINQDDTLEDIDGEDKLGQPMANFNVLRDWGALSFFVLPGFRERAFLDADERLSGGIPVAEEDATFDSGAKTAHVDFALRWAHAIGAWDIGLSHFRGTSRDPRLLPVSRGDGGTVLVPHYDQIDQTGLDVQFTSGAWLWKLEAMTRSGHGRRFVATVAGFEQTLFGVLGSNADLGLLAEYSYDGRDENSAPSTIFDDDLFLGARLSLNDIQDTSALGGAIIDRETGTTFAFVEAERRIGDHWKLELEGRFPVNVSKGDPLAGIRRDDFITLRLTRFF